MGVIKLHTFRTRGVYMNYASFRKELLNTSANVVAPKIITAARARVSGWVVPPEFMAEVTGSQQGITLDVIPIGPGADNWARVSRGVEGHYIRVKKPTTFRGVGRYRPHLRLNRYHPSTTPAGGFGARAFRMPPTGYRQVVWWPGIRPRLFEEHIAKELSPAYYRDMENAVRRGIHRAQKEGN